MNCGCHKITDKSGFLTKEEVEKTNLSKRDLEVLVSLKDYIKAAMFSRKLQMGLLNYIKNVISLNNKEGDGKMKGDQEILCELNTLILGNGLLDEARNYMINLKNLSQLTKDKLVDAVEIIKKEVQNEKEEKENKIKNIKISIGIIKAALEEVAFCRGEVKPSDTYFRKANFKKLENLRTRDFLAVTERIYSVLSEYNKDLEDELSELKKEL